MVKLKPVKPNKLLSLRFNNFTLQCLDLRKTDEAEADKIPPKQTLNAYVVGYA
jgi:hypothetical protein